MSKSKKLSKVELDVVVNEILKSSKEIKEKKIEEKYSKEIEIFDKELDLFKEKYLKLEKEFNIKIEELKKLCNKEFKISISYFNDLDKYKNNSDYYSNNRKKSYYIIDNIDSYKSRERIYNELVINGINEDINIKEVIDNYIKELVNS
jgi:hypothetical protein